MSSSTTRPDRSLSGGHPEPCRLTHPGSKERLKSDLRPFLALCSRIRRPNRLIILNFHQVTPEYDPGVHSSGTWTGLGRLEAELKYLMARYSVLPLAEALDRLKRRSLRGLCLAITFDDGDISVEQYVTPLLRRLNVPATFFINSAYLAGDGHYWFTLLTLLHKQTANPEIPKMIELLRHTRDPFRYRALSQGVEGCAERASMPPRCCVSTGWLSALDGELLTVAAHGHEHQRYAMMSDEWQIGDLTKNLAFLRQFRAFRPWFAAPFGRPFDFDDRSLRVASDLGLTVMGANGGANVDSAVPLRRIPADGLTSRVAILRALVGW